MALREVISKGKVIYVETELKEEETGIALIDNNDLDDTQEFDLKNEIDLLGDTQEFKFVFSSDEGEL